VRVRLISHTDSRKSQHRQPVRMSELDDALMEHIRKIVFTEQRPFSFVDFLPSFEVKGKSYSIDYGTLRNKFWMLRKKGAIQLDYRTKQSFYTLKGYRFGKNRTMTANHLGVQASDSFTKLISDLPYGKNALHDIHLRFRVNGIWSLLSTNSVLRIDSVSKDLRLPTLVFKDLEIRLVIHRTDTVSVVVSCSYAPIAIDCNGIIRLSNALTRVEERLCRLIDGCNDNGDDSVTKAGKASGSSVERKLLVPEHSSWFVTMWHFGRDSITEYTGDKFSQTWEVGQNALIRAYSKDMKERRRKVRLERQEYPNRSFADAVEEKLNNKGPF
jgi:hypothetical protein